MSLFDNNGGGRKPPITITNRGAIVFVICYIVLMGIVGYIETMP